MCQLFISEFSILLENKCNAYYVENIRDGSGNISYSAMPGTGICSKKVHVKSKWYKVNILMILIIFTLNLRHWQPYVMEQKSGSRINTNSLALGFSYTFSQVVCLSASDY
jgi:hypothetical protein